MRTAKRSYFQKLNPKNPKEFWKSIKFLKKKQSSIPTLTDDDGNEVLTGSHKAESLNSFFSKCFNHSRAPLEDWSGNDFHLDLGELPEGLSCDEDTVYDLLTSLDASKSNGPDGITAKMLKNTEVGIASSVLQLFNLSIKVAEYPVDGSYCRVVPIPKSTGAHSPNNYRPISLLCIHSKVLEGYRIFVNLSSIT